jgi:hypothetical protein
MLIQISPTDVAAYACDRSGAGASPTCGGVPVPRMRTTSAVRPQPGHAAFHFGSGTTEACLVDLTWQLISNKYAHPTTRVAIAFGGALGSHPARDPV